MMSEVASNKSVSEKSPDLSPRGDGSPNGSQRHDDPFQKFFEDKDHMHKEPGVVAGPEADDVSNGHTFTPFEMSVLHALLASSSASRLSVSLSGLLTQLDYYIKPSAGGADEDYIGKSVVLANALLAGAVKNDEGEILLQETAGVLEANPSALRGVHIHIGPSATPSALEALLTNEKLSDEDHVLIAQKLIQLDTEKDGVFNLVMGFREMMRVLVPIMETKGNEDPLAASEEAREIVRRIFNTASINADANYATSLSDFIELYAMEVFVIPPQYRTVDTAALTRRIDLADYSLLWAAVNNIKGIDANHIEAALTEAASVEGVVADECSLRAIVKTVTSFIEAAGEKGISSDDALAQMAEILVLNPTSLHIPVMPAEDRQEVAARKLLLYFKPSAVLSVLRALLLEDIRGDGILSKPMTETALMVELSSSSHRHRDESLGGSGTAEDEVEDYAGIDTDRVEEMIRNVLLSAAVTDSSQEVNLSHFIRTLIELTPVLPSRYCADIVVPFKPPVQLNELEHLHMLLREALIASGDALSNPTNYGCLSEDTIRGAIDTALVSQKSNEEGRELLLEAFKEMSLNGVGEKKAPGSDAFTIAIPTESSNASSSSQKANKVLYDVADALSVAIFETDKVSFHIASLNDYHAALVVSRRIAKGNVRQIAKAFIILDTDREKVLRLETFREVMKANPKFTSCEVLEKGFEAIDLDMDGALCLEEFIASFNNSPYGPALSKAQLSSLTMRRASVKELHQGQSTSATATPRQGAERECEAPSEGNDEVLAGLASGMIVAGAITTPSKAALVTSLSTSPLTATQLASSTSPLRRSTRALSPQHDASGVPVEDADLRAEFEQYDRNNNGFIDRREFAVIYRNFEHFGLEPSERDIDNLFSSVCGNRKVITFDEFSLLMLRRSKM